MATKLVYLSLYTIGLAIITWISSKRETEGEYVNAGKDLSWTDSAWTTFASLLTGYNFVLGVTFSYLYGFWYLMAFVGAGIAFVTLYFFYKERLAPLQKSHDLLSIGDYFGLAYGARSKALVNGILILGLLLFLVLQMFVNTRLFAGLLGIGKISALLATTGVVGIYLWFGGFKASVKTDIFQGILMLPILLTIFVFPMNFTAKNIGTALDPSQFWFAVGIALLQFFSLMGQAESFQRIFASEDAKALKKGMIASFILLSLVAGAIAYLGINFKLGGITGNPSDLFTDKVLGALPEWLSSMLVVSLIAAFMGTIDSSAFALGILLARAGNPGNREIVSRTRFFMLGGIALAAASSLWLSSFLAPAFALISLISVVGAALLASFLFDMDKLEMETFLAVGTATFIAGIVFKFVTDNPLSSLIPIGAAFAALETLRIIRKIS